MRGIIPILTTWYMAHYNPGDHIFITGLVIGGLFEYEIRRPIVELWRKAQSKT